MENRDDFERLFGICEYEVIDRGSAVSDVYDDFKSIFDNYRAGVKDNWCGDLTGMTQYGLTEFEAFLILAYTSGASRWLNRETREGDPYGSKCKAYFAHCLEETLKKIPSFDGQTIYRMEIFTRNTNEVLLWFKNHRSKTMRLPYFLSSSKENFDNCELVWEIETLNHGSKARDIHNLTNNRSEKEVLFQHDSKFLIQDVDLKKKMVFLSEAPHDVVADFDLVGLYHLNI
jgi:hypothetical protein